MAKAFCFMVFECGAPGDLRERLSEIGDMHGSERPYIESSRRPDPGGFDDAQLAYYLWFRDSFMDGRVLTTDEGYSGLLLVELINSRSDPVATMGHLRRYREACSDRDIGGFPAGDIAEDAMFSYAVANGLDLPRMRCTWNRWSVWPKAMASEILLPSPEPIDKETVLFVSGFPFVGDHIKGRYGPRIAELFNAALPAVDSRLRASRGGGIMDLFGEGIRTAHTGLFSEGGLGEFYLGPRSCALTYADSGERLRMFLGGMYIHCANVLASSDGETLLNAVPSLFGKDLRRTVEAVYNKGLMIRPDPVRKDRRGTVRTVSDGPACTPELVDLFGNTSVSLTVHFRSCLADLPSMEPDGPCRYIPSGTSRADCSAMSKEQMSSYLWWRAMAREGRYGRTDTGYLWLCRTELINDRADPRRTLEHLEGLAEAYGRFYSTNMICSQPGPSKTYLDYAIVNGIRDYDPTVYPCDLCACDMVERILDRRDVHVCVENFCMIAGISDWKETDSVLRTLFDDDCAIVTARVLARINDAPATGMGRYGRIGSYCMFGSIRYRMKVYDDLKYYHWPSGRPKAFEVEAMDVMNNGSFGLGLKRIIRAVASLYNGLPGEKKVKVFGTDAIAIVEEEVGRRLSERRSERMVHEQPALEATGIERAEHDLDHVTELLGIEDTDPAVQEQDAVPEPVSDDPWADLVVRLNKGQRDYLRKALAGTLRAVKATVEGSINGIAMDTVKDAIIEDGRVFEEYVEDLGNAMRMHG